tara:strand:- start:35 stop:436 length:402 start_codon:yes stop_codon:yes gene_type:complete
MADLVVKGIIKEVTTVQSGVSKGGKEWQKQTFSVSETYEKQDGTTGENLVAFELFGSEKVENFGKFNKLGDNVEVKASVRSNRWEKDGKVSYFTSANAWRIEKVEAIETPPQSQASEPFPEVENQGSDDELPF